MKKMMIGCALMIVSFAVAAQNKYSVATITAALLKSANVVKRMEEIRFEIVNLHEAIYIRKYALTILNEHGQEYADLVVGYDKMQKVENIEGALYDAAGNQLKKVKGKDINDYSATSDISLYDDNRMKVHDFNYKNYPYTVEYEVEMAYNQTYFFPTWMPQHFENLSVEKSSYTMVCPDGYDVRYKKFNYTGGPQASTDKGKKIMKWQVQNIAAIEKPYAAPPWNELTTTVYFAPTNFEMQGYKADASSWLELGKFNLLLNADRDQLPPAIQQKVLQLTEGITDPKEKVKKLYEYLQQNTRYISIQLGIGGLQPFDAAYVAQKGYGDCKALSNYMYSMLKAAGIKSYYSLVQGGYDLDDRYMMDDFSSHQFNHIIVCVPFAKDSMWLECTSQTEPAGYMGRFTGNRKALLITEEGGKLVPTPRYTMQDNLQQRSIKGAINADGTLSVTINTVYRAEQQDRLFGMVTNLSKEEVKKRLNQDFNFSSYEVADFGYTPKKSGMPEMAESLKIDVSNYATVSGRRIFIVPNVMTKDGRKNIDTTGRTADYVFDDAYCDIDTIELSIPAGYTLEALQPEVALKTKYGNYSSKVKLEGDKIIYCRKIEKWAGRYPAKEGAAIAEFYATIYKADRSRVVLVKKEG